GRDAPGHVPLVEGALVVALVGEDAGVQVVRVGQVGVALQPVQRDPVRGVELAPLPQQITEAQEHEAVRIPCQLGGERLDLVSHGTPLPCRRASAPRSWRAARLPAAPAPSPSARRDAPTGSTARRPRRSARARRGPWRRWYARGAACPGPPAPRPLRSPARTAFSPRRTPSARARARWPARRAARPPPRAPPTRAAGGRARPRRRTAAARAPRS